MNKKYTNKNKTYELIEDWSIEARAELVQKRGSEIRLLLDEAFTILLDNPNSTLSEFGFKDCDPVTQAVEWCVERFTSVDIDPDKLNKGSNSFRLFTEVNFWLTQKTGKQGHKAIINRRSKTNNIDDSNTNSTNDHSDSLDLSKRNELEAGEKITAVRTAFDKSLASTLHRMLHCTCYDLVTFWLKGTETLRSNLFDRPVEDQISIDSISGT